MQARGVALLTLVALAFASTSLGAPPAPPQTRAFTLVVDPLPCPEDATRTCLGYNGIVPGPFLDVNLGDTLVITLVNHHTAPVSWHVHGTALGSDMDGVAAHPGTKLIDSAAPAGGSFTYTVRAAFAGTWHYHDHVLGLDGGEGVAKGLYGMLVVRAAGEARPDVTLDAHLLDSSKRQNNGTAAVGDDVQIAVAGLGSLVLPVELRGPTNAKIGSVPMGPGLSASLRFTPTAPGSYKVRSATGTLGTLEVS